MRYLTGATASVRKALFLMSDEKASRRFVSFTLRELLLLAVIAALIILYISRPSSVWKTDSKALYSVHSPIEYRYWHQRGPNGSGTGQIGSGSEWQPAIGIEVFDQFVILYLDNGVDRMVEREGLRWFDWRRVDSSNGVGVASPATLPSGH
ncbi:MAG: hypothetical protein Q8M16_18170 [Pirellulaceae bacterium]|nr:hypothetical protein [Pirellulaceae bacterium]